MEPGEEVRSSDPTGKKRTRWWLWLLAAISIIPLMLLAPIVAPISLIVLITATVGLARGTRTWLHLNNRKAAISVVAAAGAILLMTSSVNAAVFSNNSPSDTPAASIPTESLEASPSPEPSTTRTPTPTPVKTVLEETVTEAIPFESTTIDDPNLPVGQTAVVTQGTDGQKTLTYRVTREGDREVSRELVSEAVTVEPIAQVTANGTYVAPPPPPAPAAPSGNCDPNYADACVPIASDVDCAGGSGNGPAYFDGIARVVGSDIYDLDRDGDGYACE